MEARKPRRKRHRDLREGPSAGGGRCSSRGFCEGEGPVEGPLEKEARLGALEGGAGVEEDVSVRSCIDLSLLFVLIFTEPLFEFLA